MANFTNRLKRQFDAGDLTAIVTWALIFGIVTYLLRNSTTAPPFWSYAIGFLGYITAYLVAVHDWHLSPLSMRWRIVALIVMLAMAFYLHWILRVDFLSILTIIWVAVMCHFVTLPVAVVVSILVIVSWFSITYFVHDRNTWIQALLYGTFHMFALVLSVSNQRERSTAQQLQAKNDQLIATQDLLAQVSRQTERTRIARDLHDLVGHHLTALTIKLQVASRVCDGEAKRQVEECHGIAKLLLNDVRDAVDTLRHNESIDIAQSLHLLTKNIPTINFESQLPNHLSIEDISIAETLMRCLQEAITNTLKHSGASKAWIQVQQLEKELVATYYDNGKVAADWKEGNGLSGMSERVSLVNGTLDVHENHGALRYQIILPMD